ncbi:MAG: alpha/beta fold hydrolase [Actinobacteria bacterium]|nr:alpha/beta fold hydrolase [Actinomycetota bacterium]
MTRDDVIFDSWGSRCAAWLYRPERAQGQRPCVVMAHGFGGVREARLDAYAERFAAAGLAVLVFDYRHFGASEGQPRQLLDIKLQLADWAAAIAYVRALEGVDAERVALWGTSFSGGHVIETAARDHRVAAVIAQAPFVDGLATLRAAGPLQALKLTREGLIDELRRFGGGEPHLIKTGGPPGSAAAMTSPDADSGYRALIPARSSWRDEISARVLLRLGLYRPIRVAAWVQCPLLICVCDDDAINPPGPALATAARAPQGEVRRYPGGHFTIYLGEPFEHAVAEQADFLTTHLLATTPSEPT